MEIKKILPREHGIEDIIKAIELIKTQCVEESKKEILWVLHPEYKEVLKDMGLNFVDGIHKNEVTCLTD